MIMLCRYCRWELSNQNKKYMVRRVGQFEVPVPVLSIERYQYGERFFHPKVKIF
jgi:hypothetical protein